MAADKFTAPEIGGNITFKRGKGGRIDGFELSAGRAAGIAFRKF